MLHCTGTCTRRETSTAMASATSSSRAPPSGLSSSDGRTSPPTLDIDLQIQNRFKCVSVRRASMDAFTGRDGAAPVGDLTGDGIADFAVVRGSAWANLDDPSPLPRAGDITFVRGRKDWPDDFDLDDPEFIFARIQIRRAHV